MFRRKKIGLALGGGGARGLAHIGVLKVLERNEIPIDFISGTSMGAMIGALYSAQPNIKKLEEDVSSKEWKKSFNFSLNPTRGLFRGDKIEKELNSQLRDIDFQHLKIPLFVTAYDFIKKQEVIFSKGDVAKAVRASISLPGVFDPVENNGRMLVDGGIVDPVPTEVLEWAGADIIIAVNVSHTYKQKVVYEEIAKRNSNKIRVPNIIESVGKSLQTLSARLAEEDLKNKVIDLTINVPLEEYGLFDFSSAKQIIDEGERAALKELKNIRKLAKKNSIKDFFRKINNEADITKIIHPLEEDFKD